MVYVGLVFGYVNVLVYYDDLIGVVYCCVCYVDMGFVFPVWWVGCVYLIACGLHGFVVLNW